MAEESGGSDDRTEAPTARRLQKARDEGQVPISREAILLAGLAAVTVSFARWDERIGRDLSGLFTVLLNHPDQPPFEPTVLFHGVAIALLAALAPFAMPAALAAMAATLLQTGFAPRTNALKPDPGRLSPGKGLKRMFGAENLAETGKSLAKLVVVGAATFQVLWWEWVRLEVLVSAPLVMLPAALTRVCIRILLAVVMAQAGIAAFDIFWVWRQHHLTMRMSRTGIKDEQKETEGDPAIKMRMRRIRMRRARQRMLASVSHATVVITNPTHYAVALTYDSGKSAVPILVAKGVDSMAARIRDSAKQHGVPIVANPPLARTLHQLPLGTKIPPELYKVVAELIAYVWRLGGRGGA